MKRLTLVLMSTAAFAGAAAPSAALAQTTGPTGSSAATGSEADYPPSYFKNKKPEILAPRKRQAKARAYAAKKRGHWGWVHIKRDWSSNTAKKKARTLRDSALTQSTVAGLLGLTPGSKAVLVGLNILEAAGTAFVSNKINDANADSNGRGVRFEAGLWCYNIPVSPDPCYPRVSITAR